MIITFFDIKGIVHKEFIPRGQTVNSGFYAKYCGDCVKKCKDIVPNFGENRPGCFTTTTHRLTLPSPPNSFWLQTKFLFSILSFRRVVLMMSFLLGISPASCSLRPTFRNVGRKLQDAGEIPKRKLIIKIPVIPHPPYSPDLAPCDFFLFPKMKFKLKGRRFDTIEDSQAETQKVLDTLTEKNFQDAFQKWRRLWDRCLHAGGNYFDVTAADRHYGEFYGFYSVSP